MDDQIFSDGIGAISVVSGTVRLDFVTYSPTHKDGNGQPAAIFQQRVILTTEGFVRSAGKIQEALQVATGRATPASAQPQSEPATGGRLCVPETVAAKRADKPGIEPAPANKRPFP